MPYAKFAYSFMCKQFMTKKNLRDTPAPTCIKYSKMVNDLLNKDYKYKVKAMLDSQKGVISEVIKRKSTAMPSIGWGAKKEAAPQTKYSGFPLKFFEEQTYLERIAEWFTTAPFYLS